LHEDIRMTYNSAYTGPQIDKAARLASIIFDDLAAMLADDRDYTAHTAGDVFWTSAEGFRYRVAASGASDHHLTTAGGVKIYVLPSADGVYNFKAFNPAADGMTDDYQKMVIALNAVSRGAVDPIFPAGPTIFFPNARYKMDTTIELKQAVCLKGDTSGINAANFSTLVFPADTAGIVVNRNDTFMGSRVLYYANEATVEGLATSAYGADSGTIQPNDILFAAAENTAYLVAPSNASDHDLTTPSGAKLYSGHTPVPTWTSAEGTIIDGLKIEGVLGSDPTAHGIRLRANATIRNTAVHRFSGDGIRIAAAVSFLAADYDLYGNANLWRLEYVTCNQNGMNGLYVEGSDANGGVCTLCNFTLNGRNGLHDRSFLGNTYVGCHTAANGYGQSGNNSGKTSIVVWNAVTSGQRYEAGWNATPAQLVATAPGTNEAIWKTRRGDTGGVAGGYVLWQAAQTEGTYFPACGYRCENDNARTLLLGCYSESDQSGNAYDGNHIGVIGGIQEYVSKGKLTRIEDGAGFYGSQFQADYIGDTDAYARIGGSSFLMLKGTPTGASFFNIAARNNNIRGDYGNSDAAVSFWITGDTTANQFGTSAPVKYLLVAPQIGIGDGSANPDSARRHQTRTAAPTTGAWARGDVVWNRSPSAGGFAGWICVTAGTPGTWKSFGAIGT
jgi:hypothetical protein